MEGRGTFASGRSVPYTYKTVGTIDGIKVLRPMDTKKSLKLPEESHKSSGYVLYDKDGVFHQYREYDEGHKVVLEIGYHHDNKLGQGDVLHAHIHRQPGIDGHKSAEVRILNQSDPIYQKYKKLFAGVKL